jgi:membrane-associated phospholipid phosphatase
VPLAYILVVAAIGDFRPEHGLIVALVCALAYATQRTKQFFLSASPYLITGIAYDALRYPRAAVVTSSQVLGCGLRSAEARLFGVGPDTTLQDWFAVNNLPALDLFCAVPYFAFAYVVLGYASYLYFVDRARMHHFLWAYAIANFIAFACWIVLPAAPPWYLRAHGCAIDLSSAPSPAALVRVDALLGISYFSGFYSRANSVFGAIPSMHCAFPLLGLLTAWKHISWRTRPIHIAYTLAMAFSAVYLDHHWVIDVLAGWAVAAVAVVLASKAIAAYKVWASKTSTVVAMQAGEAGGSS